MAAHVKAPGRSADCFIMDAGANDNALTSIDGLRSDDDSASIASTRTVTGGIRLGDFGPRLRSSWHIRGETEGFLGGFFD